MLVIDLLRRSGAVITRQFDHDSLNLKCYAATRFRTPNHDPFVRITVLCPDADGMRGPLIVFEQPLPSDEARLRDCDWCDYLRVISSDDRRWAHRREQDRRRSETTAEELDELLKAVERGEATLD